MFYIRTCALTLRRIVYIIRSMGSAAITSADIRKVTGYTRDQVRGLLDKLPGYAELEAKQGVAREYSPSDLLILTVIHHLEAKVCVHRNALATIVSVVKKELSGPKTVNPDARLVISIDPPAASYLADASTPVQEGIVVALGPIFKRVDGYLMKKFENPYLVPGTPEINFGPRLVNRSRKKVVG